MLNLGSISIAKVGLYLKFQQETRNESDLTLWNNIFWYPNSDIG